MNGEYYNIQYIGPIKPLAPSELDPIYIIIIAVASIVLVFITVCVCISRKNAKLKKNLAAEEAY